MKPSDLLRQEMGKRIRAARREAKLTMTDLATCLGYKTVNRLGKWERGQDEPTIDQLARIAVLTHKPIDYFLAFAPARYECPMCGYRDESE